MEKSYEKVVDFVQEQILDGVYSTGDKLPSEREMALQLNVSRTSVREGIRILGRWERCPASRVREITSPVILKTR